MTITQAAAPAVALDEGALQVFLDTVTDVADALVTDPADIAASVDTVLEALRDDDTQCVWVLGDGIETVDIIRSYDGDGGCDGVHVIVDLTCGIRLASLHQDRKALAGRELDRFAVIAAMRTIAREANAAVAAYLRETRAAAEVTGRRVQIDIPADRFGEHLRGLEADMGLRTGALLHARVRTDAGDMVTGVALDRDYDLDAAIGYAHRHGLRYVEVRETTVDSAGGGQ